jgi:hypothetical protein
MVTVSDLITRADPPNCSFGVSDWSLTAPSGWAQIWAICAHGFPPWYCLFWVQ